MNYTKEYIENLDIGGLTYDEQETIVNFGRMDKQANIYTSDRTVWTKLKKGLLSSDSEYKLIKVFYSQEHSPIAVEVELPKKFVLFRQKSREISEEQRKIAGERLKQMWEDKKISK